MIQHTNQHGYILLPVVIMLLLVASVAFMINHESALDIGITSSQLEARQAEAVTIAGIKHAQWQAGQQGCGPYTDLINKAFGSDSYTTTLTTDLGSTTSYTVGVDQDTWIRSDQPTNNYASDYKLHIRFENGTIERPMYRYDVSTIPAGSNILSATAWFYVSKEHPEGPVDIHLLNADWAEADATWDSMGASMDPAIQATIPIQPVAGVWVAVNLTAQVQAWVNGAPNFGITLNSISEATHGDYASIEAAQKPYLEVIVGTPPTSPAKLKSKGHLANGASHTIARQEFGLYQQPSHRMLQPASVKDVMLSEWYDTKNHGNHRMRVSTASGSLRNSLVEIDLAALPTGARVIAAELQLHHTITDAAGADAAVSVHRVTRDWVEGTQSGAGTADGATWLTRDGTNAWNTPGGDHDPTVVASSPITAATGDWESWDISTLVRDWLEGRVQNNGLLLKGAGTINVSFASKEDADPALHPRLSITYACECGSPCVAPQGMGRIALIGDDSTPDPDDQVKIGIIESWGYDVDFYEDQNSDTINWSNYDLAYVSETAISSDVAANLTVLSIGVVNEEPKLYDDLQLASGDTEYVGSSIDIIDNSHFITSVFAQGDLSIYDGDMEILTANTPLAVGLQTLGEYSSRASLTALDQGAPTTSGTAAGRRVTLPLGQHFAAGFDWSRLNNNGHLMVQRAIAWGMGAEIAAPSKQLLFVSGGPVMVQFPSGDMFVTPTAGEQLRINLIESWGYSVNLIPDDETQANFNAALASNDVVFITGEVIDSVLGNKLTNSALGVVNEQISMHDELGFSSGAGDNAFDKIMVEDNTHEITTGFATGWLIIATSSQPLQGLDNTIAPGLQTLATTWISGANYKDGLALLDTGAALFGGGSAAGRRAQLPWGGVGFDFSALNDNGKTIMQRAIEWAATVPGPKLPVAHWKLDETSGITAVDSEGGHDGTLVNSPAWVGGRVDGALSLDGNADYITVPHDDNLSLSSFSISAWIRASALSGWQVIVNKGTTTSAVNYYLATNDDEIGLGFYNASWIEFNTTTANLTTNRWYHVAATYDDSTRQGKIYLDGTLVHDSTVAASPLPNSDGLTIGRSGFGEYWPGLLDDVRIYNEVLTDSEIADLAIPPERLPIAHWKLDETIGLNAVDSIGGHDGTLNNDPVWTSGHLDGALQFDGNDDYVDLTSDAELDDIFVGGATVTAWINPSDWGENGYGRIFDKSSSASSTGDGWVIRMNEDHDVINFGQGFTGGRGWWKIPNGSITLDSWQHIAVAYDASSTAKDPVIYLNGSPVAVTRVDAPSGSVRSDASINLRLGNYAGGTTHTFDGKIDDARIYDVMLDAPEIAALAAGGGGGPGSGECDGTFRDEFNLEQYDQNDGTLIWATNWQETGETTDPTGDDIRIDNDISDFQLMVRDDGQTVWREADLSEAGSATLSFDYRRENLNGSGDYVAVEVSYNGGGNWTELDRFTGSADDSAYTSTSYPLDAASLSANTRIRFLTPGSGMGNSNMVWFDNVQILCSP